VRKKSGIALLILHPLYYFNKDDGDAYGQGSHAFGADWYVLAPSDNKVDNS
jgi:hypothetical protein